jgi:hypothetical protein
MMVEGIAEGGVPNVADGEGVVLPEWMWERRRE